MSNIAVFGESLVDVRREAGSEMARAGGSPLNVAVGLARLGADVEFATSIGRDDLGEILLDQLRSSGVILAPGSLHDGATSFAQASIGADGGATYRFELTWDPQTAPSSTVTAGHFGSISAALEPGAERVRRWAAGLQENAVVSFDPNIRTSITGTGETLTAAVSSGAALADIIKVSDEDLEALGDPDLPLRWIDDGATLVIVTRGPRGARVLSGVDGVDLPARVVRVVDTIGAGDSFMAGLLWSLGDSRLLERTALRRATLEELSRHAAFAIECAAITVSRQGADPPRLSDLSDRKESA